MINDFRSPGGHLVAVPLDDFRDTEDVMPSVIPENERNKVRDAINQSILRMDLYEVSARPTGNQAVISIHDTYGVGYYALQQLFAVGNMGRVSALAHAVRNGAQMNLADITFTQENSNIMNPFRHESAAHR